MKKLFIGLVVFAIAIGNARPAAAQTSPLTPEIRKQTIDTLTALLPERYAFREIAQKLRLLLQQNLRSGKYDRLQTPEAFAAAVTTDLRSLQPDRHLALNYNPAPPVATAAPAPARPPISPEERARRASEFNRQMNFGFRNVQFLNGNVGYLRFEYFDAFLNYSRPVVDASMAFFRNADALIIDLRDNGGGSPEMVAYIAGFFLDDSTRVATSYDRLTDTRTEEIIAPQSADKRLVGLDLYILTSKATISAAEALAYHLKYLKGARIVGETSAGAANPGRVTRLNELFTAFIPNRFAKHVITGTNWEGTGVPVDVAVPARDALRVARLEALRKLQNKTADAAQRRRYAQYITYLEKARPEAGMPESTLRDYAGEYDGGRTITLADGSLFYSRVGEVGGEMHKVAPDVFMISEGDVTVTFKRDEQGRVAGLEHLWSLGAGPSTAQKHR